MAALRFGRVYVLCVYIRLGLSRKTDWWALFLTSFLAYDNVETWSGCAAMNSGLVLYLDDHLYFNTCLVWERAHSNRRPGVRSGVSIELVEKVSGTVGDLRLLAEVG